MFDDFDFTKVPPPKEGVSPWVVVSKPHKAFQFSWKAFGGKGWVALKPYNSKIVRAVCRIYGTPKGGCSGYGPDVVSAIQDLVTKMGRKAKKSTETAYLDLMLLMLQAVQQWADECEAAQLPRLVVWDPGCQPTEEDWSSWWLNPE